MERHLITKTGLKMFSFICLDEGFFQVIGFTDIGFFIEKVKKSDLTKEIVDSSKILHKYEIE